ncbi:MAG: domain S-box protein [Segetibacter sp.]|nr:domain S-box protein [Segetibacter sp.]
MPDTHLQEEYPELQNKVVLNVDDNEMNQLVITKILERVGLVTVNAKNGAEALQKLSEGLKPDAILMDLEMPVMNGMQAAEILKKEMDSQIPIIINSGNVEAGKRWRLRKLGIHDFLEKPYTLKDIFSKLNKHLGVQITF